MLATAWLKVTRACIHEDGLWISECVCVGGGGEGGGLWVVSEKAART